MTQVEGAFTGIFQRLSSNPQLTSTESTPKSCQENIVQNTALKINGLYTHPLQLSLLPTKQKRDLSIGFQVHRLRLPQANRKKSH